jgi:hypothetical protein
MLAAPGAGLLGSPAVDGGRDGQLPAHYPAGGREQLVGHPGAGAPPPEASPRRCRTESCERNLRLHLTPLANVPLRAMTPGTVREWHAAALRGKGGRTSVAQSYRFLRMVMNTAVRDGLILRNPCQLQGAGVVKSKERPIASPSQVVALVEAITARYRAAVLLCHGAAFDGVSWARCRCRTWT